MDLYLLPLVPTQKCNIEDVANDHDGDTVCQQPFNVYSVELVENQYKKDFYGLVIYPPADLQREHLRDIVRPKQSEDEEPQVLLDENSAITPELRDALGMGRSTISYRFIPMEAGCNVPRVPPQRTLV
ncbi:hypothetical protein M514_23325 [Trichuris suis]|uniref:Uncharacterized protein n=1 Tax=Trichuris suis TaxID=68888 RepID=A0A085N4T2_9BILA|nr:hypothetical protein M514_23325 [Trichuris suis]